MKGVGFTLGEFKNAGAKTKNASSFVRNTVYGNSGSISGDLGGGVPVGFGSSGFLTSVPAFGADRAGFRPPSLVLA